MTFLPRRSSTTFNPYNALTRFLRIASLTLGLVGHEVVDLGGGSVVSADLETLVGHVEDHCRKGDF